MKFVHIADMHFDSPFTSLNRVEKLGDIRRLEQRKVFKDILEYIKTNEIPYLFISGDLYEHEYVKQSTIEYINNLFKEIPKTNIFITPGNHDPYLKNSYYNKFKWNYNVHIFNGNIEKISFKDVDIYGYGFEDFYCKNSKVENIKIENKDKINILIMHASLDTTKQEELQYNSVTKRELESLGFDYIALGHIHKTNYEKDEVKNIIYPGSTISLGFDELGKHGMIVGDIEKAKLKLEFVNMDKREFKEKEINIEDISLMDELIEKLDNIKLEENKLYKIILIGKRKFEININEIFKFCQNEQIMKIKDFTKPDYDLEKISKEESLRGFFVSDMLEKLKSNEYNKEIIEKAIEIGLDAIGR